MGKVVESRQRGYYKRSFETRIELLSPPHLQESNRNGRVVSENGAAFFFQRNLVWGKCGEHDYKTIDQKERC